MKVFIKKDEGITLMVLLITITVMSIIAGVSISFLTNDQSLKYELLNQADYLNQVMDTTNVIQQNITGELENDYNGVNETTNVTGDQDLPTVASTDDWDGTVNKPKLLSNMTAIYFEDGTEKSLNASSPKAEWDKWYDYSKKRWANAKTDDGSYWVWIPRFAYKITSAIYTSANGNVSIVFVDNKNQNSGITYSLKYPKIENGSMTDYVVHPAFCTNLDNGGNDLNISGFWVAKYEMSREDSSNGGQTWSYVNGADVLTKNAGSTSSIRVVSKPNVSSWRNITIGNAYSNSYSYNRKADSHLIKNSEWGAIAYLTQSAYGRDMEKISKNDSSSYITATGGIATSTTGNESGVYDLNGGALEYTAGLIMNSEAQSLRNEYGASFTNFTKSTALVTVYPYNDTSDTAENNWVRYNNYRNTNFGDAILEVSIAGSGNSMWNKEPITYPYLQLSYFARGAKYDSTDENSGIFVLNRVKGSAVADCSFRVVLF